MSEQTPTHEQTLAHGNQAQLLQTPPGGIMTHEVGAVTGSVEVFIDHGVVRLRYEGAIDVYRVMGELGDRSLDEVVQLLTTDPGVGADGNPQAVSLDGSVGEATRVLERDESLAGEVGRTYGIESADIAAEGPNPGL